MEWHQRGQRIVMYNDNSGVILLIQALVNSKIADK